VGADALTGMGDSSRTHSVGGHVYREGVLSQFSGRYVFGDWSREFEEPDGSLFVAMPRKRGCGPCSSCESRRVLLCLIKPGGLLPRA
jgi:hypothetical protein